MGHIIHSKRKMDFDYEVLVEEGWEKWERIMRSQCSMERKPQCPLKNKKVEWGEGCCSGCKIRKNF